jgi:hypothetical protein
MQFHRHIQRFHSDAWIAKLRSREQFCILASTHVS